MQKAKNVKNDEFYTQYEDIEKECSHYLPFFYNKVIYCNCDTENSNFVRYFKKLKELGYIVYVDELSQFKIVTKAHIASHIVQNKENEKLLLRDFGHVPQRGEFIETLMNEGCPAYVKKESITPMEASQLIKEAGGIVVLAHPVCYEHEDHINVESITHLVKEMNADGIEAIYMYIDQKNNKINDIEKWKNFALKNHLLYTMGSDFHMDDGIHPQIGLINEQVYIQNNDIQWLKKKMIGV